MPLLIRPVKMNKSIYVRVPNDIAHIIGLDNQVEVSFSFEDTGKELHLIYLLIKSRARSDQPEENRTAITKPSDQPLPEEREPNATKVENEGPTQG